MVINSVGSFHRRGEGTSASKIVVSQRQQQGQCQRQLARRTGCDFGFSFSGSLVSLALTLVCCGSSCSSGSNNFLSFWDGGGWGC
mmetsp:Transcript_52061/g.110705  ORF Transcript_52061/g.110705 Transcript_52061/m.110705 type:complete len:85 (+) Transcript_52061:91-345(+)